MKLIRKACIVFAIMFVLMPEIVSAQYQHTVAPFLSNFRNLKRYEIGGGLTMASGNFAGVVRVNGPNGYYRGDTTTSRAISSMGFGGTIGLSLPFKATGHISCWAATIHLVGNMNTWEDLNQTYGTDGTYTPNATPLNATTMQVALPIGIDYKLGNDAILTKRLLFGTALGAGIMPQFTMTTLPDISGFTAQYGYGFTPYAKLDISFFTAFCWKLRFMYSAGNVNLLDVNRRINTYNDGPFKLSSSGHLMASLIIMPFSGGWKEWAWWHTYDTYNQHDKFN